MIPKNTLYCYKVTGPFVVEDIGGYVPIKTCPFYDYDTHTCHVDGSEVEDQVKNCGIGEPDRPF